MSTEDLVQELFSALNSFKRHRALKDIKPLEKQYHELQMYKYIDKIEIGIRAINKGLRESKGEADAS